MSHLIRQLRVPSGGELQTRQPIANTITFPKELREAIPPHSARVLEFDSVTGTTNRSWVNAYNAEWLRERGYDTSVPRAQFKLLAQETGKLQGRYEIAFDVDFETLRAMGQFLIDLANQADENGTPV